VKKNVVKPKRKTEKNMNSNSESGWKCNVH